MSGSGISWATCKSAPCSRQITTPAPHHSVFTGRMPFLTPNRVKALCSNCHNVQQLTDISYRPDTQQQIHHTLLQRSIAGKNRRTDTVPLHRPCHTLCEQSTTDKRAIGQCAPKRSHCTLENSSNATKKMFSKCFKANLAVTLQLLNILLSPERFASVFDSLTSFLISLYNTN